MSSSKPRVRFAPSPTGFLHIGGVRTALFNWLYAKQTGGKFILRLEDTDRERFVVEGVEQIVAALDWFGLKPDEGFWEGEETGHVGPYVQSERLPHYKAYAEQLIESGLAYYSTIGQAEYTDLREAAQKDKTAFVYRREMESKNHNADGKFPVRLDMAAVEKQLKSKQLTWLNQVDKMTAELVTIEDFILLKADGFPTYNFANVVDDHLMEITHIMRGDEFISSTPKHALLYDLLEWVRPVWVHLPVILGPDGSKLSKRHGDTDALQYRDKGYLPEAMINFLVQLGWNDGTEQEIFSTDELIKKFSLERIQKSPAKFDIERLNWLNGLYIREKLTEDDYVGRATAELRAVDMINDDTNPDLVRKAVLLERDRIKFFSELPDMVSFFFQRPKVDPALLTKKQSQSEAAKLLELALKVLPTHNEDVAGIEKSLRDAVAEHDLRAGDFFSTIRLAITGRTASPGLFEMIEALGVVETKARINALLV